MLSPSAEWRRAVVLPHRPRGPKRLPTDHRASRFYSPKKWRRREVILPSGALPPSPLQTGAGASAGFASESPRGRICTCVDPLRRRRPELLGHAEKMDLAAGLPPTTRRSKRRMIVISPREEKSGPFTRTCTSISSFAGSRPVSWTMKGKMEPAAGVAPAWSGLQDRHVARYV